MAQLRFTIQYRKPNTLETSKIKAVKMSFSNIVVKKLTKLINSKKKATFTSKPENIKALKTYR